MTHGAIGLFGGSFNPVHHGHLIVARAVAERLSLDKVILIPSASPPHKPNETLADAHHRLAMARLAVTDEAGLEVDDIEIRRSGPSYTILTVQAYRERLGSDRELVWIIGGDTLPELATWYRAGELVDLCRMVTAVRPGFEAPDLSSLEKILTSHQITRLKGDILETPRIDISATEIRQRVAQGRSIRYLVPDPVRTYILDHKLYEPRNGSGNPVRQREPE